MTKINFTEKQLNFYRENCRKVGLSNKGRPSTKKGKTYKEIYGTDTPTCGFKKGHKSWSKGKKLSKEIKEKMSNTRKKLFKEGKIQPTKYWLGKTTLNKGKKMSEEQKKKLSIANKGQKPWNKGLIGVCKSNKGSFKSGQNHPFWNNGSSFKGYSKNFNYTLKRKIKKRDNYTCQECLKHKKKLKSNLCVHHIDYNKENDNEKNLISLCNSCHTKTNYKRKDWQNYYNNKIKEVI